MAVRRKAEVGRALKVEVEGEHLRLLSIGRHKRARTRANAVDDVANGAATHGGRGRQRSSRRGRGRRRRIAIICGRQVNAQVEPLHLARQTALDLVRGAIHERIHRQRQQRAARTANAANVIAAMIGVREAAASASTSTFAAAASIVQGQVRVRKRAADGGVE